MSLQTSPAPSPRRSNFLTTAIRRSVHSWTLWRRSRKEKALARKQAKLARVLTPLLTEAMDQALTPVAEAMMRLDNSQLQMLQMLQLAQTQPEIKELLTEVLNSLHPSPAEEIFQRAGTLRLPTSRLSSES